jgi:menaquinol-cytochrome c reductase iron-sulfur subunit
VSDLASTDPAVGDTDAHARVPDSPEVLSRRRWLSRVSIGMSGLIAAVLSVPMLAYLLTPLIRRPPDAWVSLGPVDKFVVGQTVQVAYVDPSPLPWAGTTALTSLWLRRTGPESFIAFAVNCTHLACPVNWRPEAGLFLCPCHGGVFYEDGSVAGGPPGRPLPRYQIRVVDGQVQLRTGPVPIGGGVAS